MGSVQIVVALRWVVDVIELLRFWEEKGMSVRDTSRDGEPEAMGANDAMG
jgi:hypothetical protein